MISSFILAMRYLVVAMFLASMQCAAQQAAGAGSLSGRVVDATTNDVIPEAKIIIGCITVKYSGATCAEHRVSAAPDGTFRADGLPAGNYLLIDVDDKYLGPDVTPTVTVEAGREQSNISLALLKEAVIRGKITDANGKPLSGVNVEALKVRADHGFPVVSSATTDPDGSYTLKRLRTGNYFVLAQKDSVPFFFPDTVRADDAQAIHVDFGQEFVSADIRVRPEHLLAIAGRVGDFEALPDKKALSVHVYSQGLQIPGLSPPQTSLAPDGRFHFDRIAPGDYV
ncbi:MAG: carboxypeptidase regulatory-like domain-containing protein, partial [Acidobacteriaceae bacterium]|nr:carboxypeptidase regulatory-like domain-containing protein [Acidobacteriaceae bacterium]